MNTILLLLLLCVGVVAAINTRTTMVDQTLNIIEKKSLNGLFLNKKELFAIAKRDQLEAPVFRLKDFSVLFKFGASCSPSVNRYMKCKSRPSFLTGRRTAVRKASLRNGNPCCDTNTIMVQPNSVTGVDTMTYQVVQEPDSVQIVHLGTCNSKTQGSVCSNAGFCTQQYRMQWLLVHTSPTEKKFVPVEMHNHCVCNFI
ncbi:uncharacterized protein LOC121378169 [Gigantopelta aegis]|uniref:uncharacterized protein LOC121378169 n=1 Tax=Gigantopelta aegis TaxID=1735272 RepID=UPI001B88D26D|nr:uncharacterized protein LOC121378169 [Gigantopelta aegis]